MRRERKKEKGNFLKCQFESLNYQAQQSRPTTKADYKQEDCFGLVWFGFFPFVVPVALSFLLSFKPLPESPLILCS
jgi:hypothetical protein